MTITAVEICKSFVTDATYKGKTCRGFDMYRVYGKEMSTLVTINEIYEFYTYVMSTKTLHKKFTKEVQAKLSEQFDNYTKQVGTCGICNKCQVTGGTR